MTQEPEPLARVRAALARWGRTPVIRVFDQHLPTAQAAAEALGVELGRIAKSIVLLAEAQPVLVVTAGDRRVDRQKVKANLGVPRLRTASAEEVLAATGFVAGGVAPVGLTAPAAVLLDISLQRYPEVWAGGGVPEALVCLRTADLPLVTGGRFADVCQDPA